MLRRRFGWIAQQPNPFPRSIRLNILYGPKIQGLMDDGEDADALVERSLRAAGLWAEVKDRLAMDGNELSIGQQQRLCIARALATDPEVLLMDEPASALDPIATAKVEELIDELRENYTIVIVTHSMQQAARVSQRTAFFHLGILVEEGPTDQIFTNPHDKRTQDYICLLYTNLSTTHCSSWPPVSPRWAAWPRGSSATPSPPCRAATANWPRP